MNYYVVDAFADALFTGNPAGVCVMDTWPNDELMQSIAAENNLAETAFAVKNGDVYDLRWFTPETEIDLCGHATLAAAFVIANFVDKNMTGVAFSTKSGILTVTKSGDLYEMDFPTRKPKQVEILPIMEQAIGAAVLEAHLSRDMLLVVETEQQVKDLNPTMDLVAKIPDCFALVVTAKGEQADFVSRCFVPNAGIPEDPVTGSSHSSLIPFWAERLNKDVMVARQLSKRGGTLYCRHCGQRVKIAGKAILYMTGELAVPSQSRTGNNG